jgi:hypothetical protein
MIEASRTLSPANGIKTIKYSLKCFAFSFGGLIPVLGVPLMVQSLSYYRKARAASKGCWNPAKNYLAWGFIIDIAGLLITIAVLVFISFLLLELFLGQNQDQ